MVEKKVSPLLLEGVKILLPALILVLLVNTFILRLFVIPSPSMEPALRTNDYIVAAKFSYWFNTPQRGEIIVFKHPLDPRVYMVKRIIGLPGETVSIEKNQVHINGEALAEPYVQGENQDYREVTVPADSYFVLGDNREGSQDSRAWGFVPRRLIVGKVVFRYWPLSRVSVIGK